MGGDVPNLCCHIPLAVSADRTLERHRAQGKFDLIATEDGSLTCLCAETGELYHNRAGAITEAKKNYVEPSDAKNVLCLSDELQVIDACFGLGYNTWVLVDSLANGSSGRVHVLAFERDPEIVSCLDQVLNTSAFATLRQSLPSVPTFGHYTFSINQLQVELDLCRADLREAIPALPGSYDLVFHDPFSPKRMPELWTVDLFSQYFRLLSEKKGRVLTYSAAVAVRAGFAQTGFSVFRTAAVGGKSGGTAALHPDACMRNGLFELTADERAKWRSRSGVPYRDRSWHDSRQDIWKRRAAEQVALI